MDQPAETRKVAIPVLVAVLICDAGATDRATGKKSLIGVFDQLNVARFPTSRPVTAYVRMTDAQGKYNIQVRWVQRSSGQKLAEALAEAEVKSRLGSFDLLLDFPPLPIPTQGRYELQVWANDVFLGSTFLDAVPRSDATKKG